ncbi:MAG: hypothetical protein OHK0022_04660 [Roseiflexaceae bacterium]
MYRAILFDLDDTLYDFRAFWTGRLERGLAPVLAQHPELQRAELVRAAMAGWVFTETMAGFLREQGVRDEELIQRACAAYEQGWFDDMTLPEEAAQTLRALHGRYRLGLITNGPARTQRPKIERFGLADHMDVLIVSEEAGVAKPDPRIFAIALEQLGVRPADALFVGDSPEHDIRGATAAGIDVVWLNRHGGQLPQDLPAPKATIERLADLLPLLQEPHLC